MLGQNLVNLSAATITPVSIVTPADVAAIAAPVPLDLVRWGFIAYATAGGTPVITLDKRITVGSDTGRVVAWGGTLTPGAIAAGKVAYREVANLELNPGEEMVFDVTTGATSTGTGIFFIEFLPRPYVGARIANATKLAA